MESLIYTDIFGSHWNENRWEKKITEKKKIKLQWNEEFEHLQSTKVYLIRALFYLLSSVAVALSSAQFFFDFFVVFFFLSRFTDKLCAFVI